MVPRVLACPEIGCRFRFSSARIPSQLEPIAQHPPGDPDAPLPPVFLKGPFPDGGVLSSPNFRLDVLDEFFAEHCPKHCSYNNPPPSEVIGVAALAQTRHRY
jgi:hypothetical protein